MYIKKVVCLITNRDGNKNHVPKCFNLCSLLSQKKKKKKKLCSLKSNHYLIIESEFGKNGV